MSYEVGKKALDFLIANSGNRRNLEVDFFGGEPLMNWQVVKDLVAYGREQEKIHNKNFRFTLKTNGVLLNDEVQEFEKTEISNVVLSIDGRKEVHDYMRPFRNGRGSYDLIPVSYTHLDIIIPTEYLALKTVQDMAPYAFSPLRPELASQIKPCLLYTSLPEAYRSD